MIPPVIRRWVGPVLRSLPRALATILLSWTFAGLICQGPKLVNPAHGEVTKAEFGKYTVDGLPLGGAVRPKSSTYKEYNCEASAQFHGFTFSQRKRTEKMSGRDVTATTTILHADDGTVAYVNRFIEPAFLTPKEVENEIDRLSTKYGQKGQVLETRRRPGIPQAWIASWGSLRLIPLAPAEIATQREGRSPGKGILADFLVDFTRSAQLDLPIYSFQGDFGFVWIASFDEKGRSKLRFFAINASRLSAARQENTREAQRRPQPSPENARAEQESRERAAEEVRRKQEEVARKLEECGESCPDKPELDKLRRDSLEELEQQKLAADDAASLMAALGHEQALNDYISSCTKNKCEFRDDAITERDALRRATENKAAGVAEERQFRSARDNIPALKKYVADCDVCAFASEAVQ